MSIHSIYSFIFRFWRQKRQQLFENTIRPEENEVLLDVGGCPTSWTARPQLVHRIECLNLNPIDWDATSHPSHNINTLVGDGCSLDIPDRTYEIVFSNSVVEHVGDWEQQQAFAKEIRRVGNRLWVQTPAYGCPIEPHYLAPFVHWLPIKVRRLVVRWFTPWGLLGRRSRAEVKNMIDTTRILKKREFQALFPDCEILTERLVWIFPKSYIAVRGQE